LGRWIAGAGLLLGAAALVNAAIAYRTPPLPNPFDSGQGERFPLPEGDVWYTIVGSGPPVLLLHSIGAGCSSFEWSKVVDKIASRHTVFLVDIPGFGKSDRPDVAYDSEYFLEFLALFCDRVVAPTCPGQTVDIVAVSLSAAWAIVLAGRRPELVGRLALVSPFGITSGPAPLPLGRFLGAIMRIPILGNSIRNSLTSRRAIHATLSARIFANSDRVDPEIVTSFHIAAHQPGHGDVLAHFVNGDLFIPAEDALRDLPEPPLMIFGSGRSSVEAGDRDRCRQIRPDAPLIDIPDAGALPHLETPDLFLQALDPWLAQRDSCEKPAVP
jgi:pimeloyl-ACP methyl ester carboxylesterase